MVQQLPGNIRHAADLRRSLDLDTKVSTQIYRVAMTPSPAANAMHVPGPPSMNRFLDASARAGATEESIGLTHDAYREFLAFVTTSAGDRTTFDSMVASLEPGTQEEAGINVEHRKKAFRAMSHLTGIQAETLYRCAILFCTPSGRYDYAQLRMFREVRKLSANASVLLYRSTIARYGDNPAPFAPSREPIDPAAPHERGTNIFPEFSSKPLPGFRVVDGPNPQSYKTQLDARKLGNDGLADLAFGHVDRNVFAPADGTTTVENHAGIYFPVARLVQDMILPARLDYRMSSTAYANLYEVEMVASPADRETLPVGAPVQELHHLDALAHKDCPAYADLVRHALACLGVAGPAPRIYRRVTDYPVLHSLNILRADAAF